MRFSMHLLASISLLLFTQVSSNATSPPVRQITKDQLKSLKPGEAVFEADIVSYEKIFLLHGQIHRITEAQLQKLKAEAYALAGDDKKITGVDLLQYTGSSHDTLKGHQTYLWSYEAGRF